MPENAAPICAVIAEETAADARAAMERAAAVADLAELRLDYLRDFDFSRPENLRPLLEHKPLPVILTCRAVSEGGKQHVEDNLRLKLLVEGARTHADYCDIEAACYAQAASLQPDISRLIISYHNFTETPPDLESIYECIIKLPAAVHKIATRAGSITDTLAIFRLLGRARQEGRKLLALAMEEPGLLTRVLGPSRGSFLTFGSLRRGHESAPGQLTCEELRRVYRLDRLSVDTMVTGVIGRPVAHSASPAMHNAAFERLGLDGVYARMEVEDLPEFFARFVRPQGRELDWHLRGLSVTIPHKSAVIALLDELDPAAESVGAVNTVVIQGNRLVGYNTDIQGAMGPLEKVCALDGESVGVIGAGGSARAVVYGLVRRGARVAVLARDLRKARALADEFGVSVMSLESIESSDARVLINTTPVGMRGHSENASPVPRPALRGRSVAYDLVYNPVETPFLKGAKAEGCRTVSGLEMLVAQAAIQFELWTGLRPPVDLMRQAALNHIAASGC